MIKREDGSSLLQLKPEFRTYEALRREHDAQIVSIGIEVGLLFTHEKWSQMLYGDSRYKPQMQSITDKVTIASDYKWHLNFNPLQLNATNLSFDKLIEKLNEVLSEAEDPIMLLQTIPFFRHLATLEVQVNKSEFYFNFVAFFNCFDFCFFSKQLFTRPVFDCNRRRELYPRQVDYLSSLPETKTMSHQFYNLVFEKKKKLFNSILFCLYYKVNNCFYYHIELSGYPRRYFLPNRASFFFKSKAATAEEEEEEGGGRKTAGGSWLARITGT